jgi:hypothetical protein
MDYLPIHFATTFVWSAIFWMPHLLLFLGGT